MSGGWRFALVVWLVVASGCGRLEFAPLAEGTAGGDGSIAGDGALACASWSGWDAPMIVSELESPFGDSAPALRADGLEVVFARLTSMNGDFDLYEARRSSTSVPFGTPVPLTALNTLSHEEGAAFSADGLTLYWMSYSGGIRLWQATRTSTADTFATPALVPGGPFDEQSDPSVTADGLELYQASSFGDLYVSTRLSVSASFGTPVLLAAPIASAQWQEGPSISADGRELYWSEDAGGLFVIRTATRPGRESPFGTPTTVTEVEVGQAWNPEISADGRTLMFSRFVAGIEEIYITQRTCI